MQDNRRRFVRLRIFIALLVGYTSIARAESLRIAVDRAEIRVYNPVSITITWAVNGIAADRLQHRDERGVPVAAVGRRFRAILRDELNVVRSRALVFREWSTPAETNPRVFVCKGIAFFVVFAAPEESSSDSNTLLTPGRYSIVVIDEEHSLESNPVEIDVLALNARERLAADVFLRAYPEGIELIMEHEGGKAASELFRVLAEEYGDTELGRMAGLALALQRVKDITSKYGGARDPRKWESIADDISAALETLPTNHPLRAEALFQLSVARAGSEELDQAEAALTQLEQTYPHGKWAWMGRRLAEELKVFRETQDRGGGGE